MSDAIELCDTLLDSGDKMLPAGCGAGDRLTNYHAASQLVVKLKTLNRYYYSKLDNLRQNVEKSKELVDKRRLLLENLQYEADHWTREINITKEFDTPQLSKLENDLNNTSSENAVVQLEGTVASGESDQSTAASLCKFNSSKSLEIQNEEYLAVIKKEKDHREELREVLNKKQLLQYKMSERLNKKRKFLEDLPTRVSSIVSIARTLQPHFEQVIDSSEVSAGGNSSTTNSNANSNNSNSS